MQLVIVYIIVGLTIAYAIYAIVRNIHKKEPSSCEGCNGCDLRNEIMQNCDKKKNVSHSSSCNTCH